MKRFWNTPTVLSSLLALIFIWAACTKIAGPLEFQQALRHYDFLPAWTINPIAILLPWWELGAGIGLFVPAWRQSAVTVILLLLGCFIVAIVEALVRGLDISCGCFTQDPSVGKVGWYKVGENGAMILGSLVVFYSRSLRFSLERHFRMRQMQEEGKIVAPQPLE